jgi:hypothetical protein
MTLVHCGNSGWPYLSDPSLVSTRHGAVLPFSFVLFVLFVAKLVVPSRKNYSHKEHQEHKDSEGE